MGHLTEVLRNVSLYNEKQIGCFGQVTGELGIGASARKVIYAVSNRYLIIL